MAKKDTAAYDAQSIVKLKGAERVRLRPEVMFGSKSIEGCKHSFFEILSNSVDEAREGYGGEVSVTVYRDKSIEVSDHGRGVPLGYNENEGCYNWELIYCELYAGGKYDNNSDAAAYKFSLGLNGLGACATQYSSEYFDVASYDGDNVSRMHFEKGEPVGKLEVTPLAKNERRTGTVQRWRPDLEVFTDIDIPREYFEEVLKKQSVVNSGIRFVLNWQNDDESLKSEEFIYPNGISDYIDELAGDTAITSTVYRKMAEVKGRDRDDLEEYKLVAEVAFCFSKSVNVLEYYHNSSFLEHGGSPERAVKTAFTFGIDKKIKVLGKYKKNEKISFADIEDCLILVANSFSTVSAYENQTKKAVENKFIADAMTSFLKEQLEIYFLENPADTEKIVNQVLINMRARETAERTKLDLKKTLSTANDPLGRVEKFVACRSKDATRSELYIVEGDSAMTSCKLGRDAEFQAIIPVRGKTLNCLKCTYDRIFKSDIIVDLIKVIGCGVEVKSRHKKDEAVPFNLDNLKWSKIIICTDADEDGFQIRTLILTMFYRLLPTLINEGRVFIAESPLYEITVKDEILFAYNEPEKAEILKKLEGKKYTLQRSKGLGENEPDMMWKTTMNPATRRLIRVTRTDAEATARVFDVLLGDNLPARKQFIAEYANLYIAQADI